MKIAAWLVLLILGAFPRGADAQRICEQGETELFICQTDSHEKYLGICAVEDEPGKTWSSVQYRFGDGNKAELVYPANAQDGAKKLFFSHAVQGTMYRVSVRFKSGGYTYLLESYGDDASDPPGNGVAGVTVTNASGKTVANITCIERPLMFPSYLRMALACDLENPHGNAGCIEPPPHEKKAVGSRR
jgi:hypothetical protein